MCLEALGVVKVATPEQIRRLMCPGTKAAATVRGGLKDLEAEKLVISPGSATRVNAAGVRVTEKLWTLTPAGLEAAAVVLDRPAREMGGTARAAAASGAKHARKVTDTLAAFLQTPPESTRPVTRTANLIPAQAPTTDGPQPEGLHRPTRPVVPARHPGHRNQAPPGQSQDREGPDQDGLRRYQPAPGPGLPGPARRTDAEPLVG
ncbi:replication-relaxation family protein [[Kitasatospora] papulosa]|uniref:replication-relaxation family protein n=1 Tax=[Kitasatospora] papulosa TaxID=1464011 RepID=UPI0036AB3BA5